MRNLIIALSVLALVIAVFAGVALFGKKTAEVSKDVQTVAVEGVGVNENDEPKIGVGSLFSLQALETDLECQIIHTGNDGKNIEGTFFVSDKKMRGDFMVPAPEFGGEIVSSIILVEPMLYVWSTIGNETYGFKSDQSAPSGDGRVDRKEPVPLDAQVRYSCAPWLEVDGSVFAPPAAVDFKDLGAVIEAGMEY